MTTLRLAASLFCIAGLSLVATGASAGCATGYVYIGGSCYRAKGVQADIEVKKVANAEQNPKFLQMTIHPSSTVAGILFCGNRASNQPPGITPVIFTGTFGASTTINSATKNGSTRVSLTALLSADQLAALDAYCPNTQNFDALDFVPCQFDSALHLSDINTSRSLEAVTHACTLADCYSLKWDKKTDLPEPRAFDCVTK